MRVDIKCSIQIISILLLILSCKNSPSDLSAGSKETILKMNDADWLIGAWHAGPQKDSTYETWHKANDTLFTGESFFIKRGDTVLTESIKIVARDNEVNYMPTVSDQNDGLPVIFKLTYIDPNKMVFENQAHDFPQTITYHQVSSDSLIAEISGTVKGEYRAKRFPMKRIP